MQLGLIDLNLLYINLYETMPSNYYAFDLVVELL
jgi:hypothetical protein